MGILSERHTQKSRAIRLVLFCFPMWVIYVGYHFFNKYVLMHNQPDSSWLHIFDSSAVRFAIREVMTYTMGFIGYYFVKRNTHSSFHVQFWVLLALLDVFCITVGLIRVSVINFKILHDFYNNVILIISTPLYFVFYSVYAIYFDPNTEYVKNQ